MATAKKVKPAKASKSSGKTAAPKSGASAKRASSPRGSTSAANGNAALHELAEKAASSESNRQQTADASLFEDLTVGETADAMRTLLEDRRLHNMAKVGRYRLITCEPLVVKPPHWLSGHRLARVVVYDYAADRCVDACVDLDASLVAHLEINRSQPMLCPEEESVAIVVAASDAEVQAALAMGEQPQLATHYWGRRSSDIAYSRRAAAVLFGLPNENPRTVVVVDLLDQSVIEIASADKW